MPSSKLTDEELELLRRLDHPPAPDGTTYRVSPGVLRLAQRAVAEIREHRERERARDTLEADAFERGKAVGIKYAAGFAPPGERAPAAVDPLIRFDCITTVGDGRAKLHTRALDGPAAMCSSLEVAYALQDAIARSGRAPAGAGLVLSKEERTACWTARAWLRSDLPRSFVADDAAAAIACVLDRLVAATPPTASPDSAPAEMYTLALCELDEWSPRPGVLYRFEVHDGCAECRGASSWNCETEEGWIATAYPLEEVGAVGKFRAFKYLSFINITDDGIGIASTKSTRQALRIMNALVDDERVDHARRWVGALHNMLGHLVWCVETNWNTHERAHVLAKAKSTLEKAPEVRASGASPDSVAPRGAPRRVR